MAPNLQATFWHRMGLGEQDRDTCLQAIEEIYPNHAVKENAEQGYCSFTLRISHQEGAISPYSEDGSSGIESTSKSVRSRTTPSIVQIRPLQHSPDLTVAQEASSIYEAFAPRVRELHARLPGQLKAFEMELLPGIPSSLFLPRSISLTPDIWRRQTNLIRSFASFIACSWPNPQHQITPSRNLRADSPMHEADEFLSKCTGRVGKNIVPKLEKMVQELPDQQLRTRARETLEGLLRITDYPVSVCHGDLIPTNVLMDPATWSITGIVDWAEAEYLPFGMCLYGLEHFLGYLHATEEGERVWRYYENAVPLRQFFWKSLIMEAPEVKEKIQNVSLMRDVGVLLWYGYAWDEGRIDRVVCEERDADEVACLRTFLGTTRDF